MNENVNVTPAPAPALPSWVLTTTVTVTLVAYDGLECSGTFLVKNSRDAVALTFWDTSVLVNGKWADLGEDLMAVCSLIDDCYPTGYGSDDLGVSHDSEPYSD